MPWIAEVTASDRVRGEIIFDRYAGYYLHIWMNDQPYAKDLQDTLEFAMRQAEEEYHIPRNAWREVASIEK